MLKQQPHRLAYLLTPVVLIATLSQAQSTVPARKGCDCKQQTQMDRDLLEVTAPQLHSLYANHKYTVTQVVQWYLARIEKYNGIYRAMESVDAKDALASAAREDAEARAGGQSFQRGALWGIPIVIKANTSIEGQLTSDGWKGYALPAHELIAPQDATIVKKLKAAGAVVIGHTNMPDFAASDTNRSSVYGRTGNAYDVRFSPGGSSGGTVTAVTSNLAVLGNGTDTGNSIRMPAATSAVVGVFPTRGLVSTAGIAPLDWLLDNTGPIARTVSDAAIALDVMAGVDPLDPRTAESAKNAPAISLEKYLKTDALKGKRFGVPAFILRGTGIPFQGIPGSLTPADAFKAQKAAEVALQPETRKAFLAAVEELRAAGATVVFDEAILPDDFANTARRVFTRPYVREGTEQFLKTFGPAQYHSIEEYQRAVGSPLPATVITGTDLGADAPAMREIAERNLEGDSQAELYYFGPRKQTLDMYDATLDRFHLDGYVYPAIQMPPPDETMPQDGRLSEGPHSATSWVNMIGVPAVVVPAGFYPSGLPFGLEISARRWHDGEVLGYAYAYEQATKHRKPPVLVESGLLPNAH